MNSLLLISFQAARNKGLWKFNNLIGSADDVASEELFS